MEIVHRIMQLASNSTAASMSVVCKLWLAAWQRQGPPLSYPVPSDCPRRQAWPTKYYDKPRSMADRHLVTLALQAALDTCRTLTM